jgi:hypothetical protein
VATSPPTKKGILELLDFNSSLKTPVFQRSFAWRRAQVDDMWDDLKRAVDAPNGPEEYFLGLIVLDDKDQIQDGQQRLATTLLLAAEMHQLIESAKQSGEHDEQVATDAVAQVSPALRQSPNKPLVISIHDQEALLSRTGIRSDSPESARRLAAARLRLHGHLEHDLQGRKSADAKIARLKQWGEFLRGAAYTVVLRVPTKDAHNIFETLNTRGVRLTNGDLVKSHLIARATDTALAVSKWNQVTQALKDERGRYEADLETFLLHYFGSRYGKTTKAEFFADYRAEVEGSDALATLDELLENAGLYRALVAPDKATAFWTTHGPGTQQAIELLNGLGLKQLRYMLLSVLRDFAPGGAKKARLKKQGGAVLGIVAWSMRGLVHGRTGGGEAERTYISGAKEIREGRITSIEHLKKWFVQHNMLVLDNDAFRNEFMTFRFDSKFSHNRARAVLYALEYYKVPNKSGLTPRRTLTLEHVLPQSPAPGQWAQFTAGERDIYAYKLGNLLLIDGPSGANDQLANKEWPAKRQLIKSWPNQTPLTTEALKQRSWGKATINKRTRDLADLSVKAWKA